MVRSELMAQRPSLIPVVIELGLSTAVALQEVQARQVIYGGDQQLNLAELGLVNEAQLLEVVARAYQHPTCAVGPVLVNRHLTARLRSADCDAVAGIDDVGAWHAYVDYVDDALSEQIRSVLGEMIQIWLTSSLRMEEATALASEGRLDPRVNKVLNRWGPRLTLPDPADETVPEAERSENPTEVIRLPDVAPAIAAQESGSAPIASAAPAALAQVAVAPAPAAGQAVVRPLPEVEAISVTRQSEGMEPATDAMAPVPSTSAPLDQLDDSGPQSGSNQGVTAPPPDGYEHVAASSGAASQKTPPVQEVGEPSYPVAEAISDLANAKSRDKVIGTLVRCAASYFDYAAAFGLLSKEAKGLQAAGNAADSTAIAGLSIPLDLPSAFSRVQQSAKPEVTRLRASGLEGGAARDLARVPGTEVFLLPIVVQERPLLLLWADNAGLSIPESAKTALLTLAEHVGQAIARVLIERKRQSRMAQPGDMASMPPQAFSQAPPPMPVLAQALARSAGAAETAEAAEAAEPAHTAEPPAEIAVAEKAEEAPEEKSSETRRNPAAAPADAAAANSPHEVAPAKKRTLTRRHATDGAVSHDPNEPPSSFPPEPPRTLRGFPEVKSPSQVARDYDQLQAPAAMPAVAVAERKARPALMSRRIVPVGQTNPPPPASESDNAAAAPQASDRRSGGLLPEAEMAPVSEFSSVSRSDMPAAFEAPIPTIVGQRTSNDTLLSQRAPLSEPDAAGWDTPHAPSLRPLPASLADTRTRSYSELVDDLLAGDERVIDQLMDGGETAVGALIAQFPGPVVEPAVNTAASDCGPILKALIALGHRAIPFITVRTADEDPEVRRWATFLLGELPGRESAKAIASRLLDSSVEVRRAALASARRARSDQLTRRMLRGQIEELCRDPSLPAEERSSAIEALADIREHEAIPTLLQLLEADEPALQRASRWALRVLTRQDFGEDVSAWRKFWQQHRDEDRVEWLISSLDHEERDIRRAAGEELCAISGHDYGFNEDQSSAERRVAQAKFRSWWSNGGKAANS